LFFFTYFSHKKKKKKGTSFGMRSRKPAVLPSLPNCQTKTPIVCESRLAIALSWHALAILIPARVRLAGRVRFWRRQCLLRSLTSPGIVYYSNVPRTTRVRAGFLPRPREGTRPLSRFPSLPGAPTRTSRIIDGGPPLGQTVWRPARPQAVIFWGKIGRRSGAVIYRRNAGGGSARLHGN